MDNHVFVDAYFTNNERSVVETIWYSESEDVYRSHSIVAEESEADWIKLLETVSLDDLHERTYKKIAEANEEYKETLIDIANNDGNGWIAYKDDINRDALRVLMNVIFDENLSESDGDANKEKLFLYKMEFFERDFVKKSTNKELKRNLRKAKSMIEATQIACLLYNESEFS